MLLSSALSLSFPCSFGLSWNSEALLLIAILPDRAFNYRFRVVSLLSRSYKNSFLFVWENIFEPSWCWWTLYFCWTAVNLQLYSSLHSYLFIFQRASNSNPPDTVAVMVIGILSALYFPTKNMNDWSSQLPLPRALNVLLTNWFERNLFVETNRMKIWK